MKNSMKVMRSLWHGMRGLIASILYGLPATKLVVIGITGTKGKTTTTVYTARLMNTLGIKTGCISTAIIDNGSGERQNTYKMTTIDPVLLQRELKEMVKNRCTHVVLEMSSQGLESNRHLGLFGFDIAVFLNLYPEHIEAHGSFEKYRASKAILFESLRVGGIAIANGQSKDSDEMFKSIPESVLQTGAKYLLYPSESIRENGFDEQGLMKISVAGLDVSGIFLSFSQVENYYFAANIAEIIMKKNQPTIRYQDLFEHAKKIIQVPGRYEYVYRSSFVDCMIDYAHEPESMRQLLELLQRWKGEGLYNFIIHIVSCDGAGRDDWKKKELGTISYTYADFSYLTTDNYSAEDNPETIVELLASELPQEFLNKKYFLIPDRKMAMQKAYSFAKTLHGKTLIVSTGVGNEYGLMRPEGRIPWDEKKMWLEVIDMLGKVR